MIVAAARAPQQQQEAPRLAAGLAPGRRFYDPANAIWIVKVYPGDFQLTSRADEVLVTVLGSCVAAVSGPAAAPCRVANRRRCRRCVVCLHPTVNDGSYICCVDSAMAAARLDISARAARCGDDNNPCGV